MNREAEADHWKHRAATMRCATCMYFVEKGPPIFEMVAGGAALSAAVLGRCRRRAPTLGGWPAVFNDDWCGDHKLDTARSS